MSFITDSIDQAVACLKQGELVAMPTETVYGLAADAENEQAIGKIFALKNRPLNHPLIMHIAANWDIGKWAEQIPDYVTTLIDTYWPGPLTIVLPCRADRVSPLVNGGQTTIALRCPNHPVSQALLKAVGKPLVAPSANPFGKISPTTAQHVHSSFPHDPLLILEGGRCQVGIESTIIAALNPTGYQILRQGVIDEQALAATLPQRQLTAPSSVRAPGRLETHYQPNKPLFYFTNLQSLLSYCKQHTCQPFVLSFSRPEAFAPNPGVQLASDPHVFAFELYYQLRAADERPDVDVLLMEMPPDTPTWQGVRERILKAGRAQYTS